MFFQGLAIDKRLHCEIVEQNDMRWEDIDNKVIHAFILPLSVLLSWVYLFTLPIKNQVFMFILER